MRVEDFMKDYENTSVTENGAIGYRTTLHPLADLNFKVSSLRNRSETEIVQSFVKAFFDDKVHTVKWLFFLRDIMEGLGERRTFRICLTYLAVSQPKIASAIMELVPEYGRYDDWLSYLDTPLRSEVCTLIQKQLNQDIAAMNQKQPVSLLAKWLPSINTSSKNTRRLAAIIAKELNLSDREYRKCLSSLRAYSDVVEVKLSANEWNLVNYEKVPAKANLKYEDAFTRHDKDRRLEYLKEVFLGDSKLNTNGLVPYEIVHRLLKSGNLGRGLQEDCLAELMWQKLIETGYQNEWGLSDCIVVADGSGSMYQQVSGQSKVLASEVCYSLAIYFAQQLSGVFHNKAITFSERPRFIDLSAGNSLKDKLEIMFSYDEVANTNIEAVFAILLSLAVSQKVPADQIPKQVLIISDMEFDAATEQNSWSWCNNGRKNISKPDKKLFTLIKKKYEAVGYTMPRLIFWNVCGRTDTIPMNENENGVCLISGFSQNAMKVAANKEVIDPYQSLLLTLDGPRYDKVEEAIKNA